MSAFTFDSKNAKPGRSIDLVETARAKTPAGKLPSKQPSMLPLAPCSICSGSGSAGPLIRCRPCGGSGER